MDLRCSCYQVVLMWIKEFTELRKSPASWIIGMSYDSTCFEEGDNA